MFYINAPGIAGGSLRKAREQGRAILEIDGAAYKAHIILALTEAEDDNWDAAGAEFNKAREVASSAEEKLQAVAAHANMLLTKKEDPKATIAFLVPVLKDFGTESWQLRYFLGQAYYQAKDWPKAQAEFEVVLAAKPDARNSSFLLAEVLRKQKLYPQAAAAYRAFSARFPDDKRASKALEEAADCDSR
jgi:tetratricopeptide (TPR) repeat protein